MPGRRVGDTDDGDVLSLVAEEAAARSRDDPAPSFRVLGPVDVVCSGEPVPITGERQRAVLAVLLLSRNEVVSSERLTSVGDRSKCASRSRAVDADMERARSRAIWRAPAAIEPSRSRAAARDADLAYRCGDRSRRSRLPRRAPGARRQRGIEPVPRCASPSRRARPSRSSTLSSAIATRMASPHAGECRPPPGSRRAGGRRAPRRDRRGRAGPSRARCRRRRPRRRRLRPRRSRAHARPRR